MASKKKAAPEVQPIELDTGTIEMVPLASMAVSPLNVRKDATPDEELISSIGAHGLLQPLIGYANSEGSPRILICAGQRRFLALNKLVEDKRLSFTAEIPVRIVDQDTAIEISLAENLERKNMNPADEFAAFKALIDTGTYDAARIASRFGFTLQHVRRRLRMAGLFPPILEAVREGAITIDAALIYAAASQEAQEAVFKKHSSKNAWKPHEPGQVKQDLEFFGVSIGSIVGRFIGGVEAYKKAGGEMLDADFMDLFGKDEDLRMRDVSIVKQLVERRQGELAPKVEAMVAEKYPFATSFEWCNTDSYGGITNEPKPGKKSGLVHVGTSWNDDKKATVKRVKKAAEKHGATVIALVGVTTKGDDVVPYVIEGHFHVGADAWKATEPKGAKADESRGYHQQTPEERAAQERERKIREQAARLYGRSLIGETPGFGVIDCDIEGGWSGRPALLHITLTPLEGTPAEAVDSSGYQAKLASTVLEPFLEAAEKRVDEIAAEDERRRQELAEEQAKQADASAALLEEIELLPLADWPHEVTVTDEDGDTIFTATRIIEDGEPALECLGADGDTWTTNNVLELVETIRDNLDACGGSLSVVRDAPPVDMGSAEEVEPVEEEEREAA